MDANANRAFSNNVNAFVSHQHAAVNSISRTFLTQWIGTVTPLCTPHHGSLDFLMRNSLGRAIVGECKSTRRGVSEADLRMYWVDVSRLQSKRKKYGFMAEYMREWLRSFEEFWFVCFDLDQEKWTQKFLDLSEDVLGKDNWVVWLESNSQEIVKAFRIAEHQRISRRAAEQVRTLVRQVASIMEGLHRHYSRLCQLAKSLIVSSSWTFSTFLTQRRWFITHGAHPPRLSYATSARVPGGLSQTFA